MDKLKTIISGLKGLFSPSCPDCGGRMKALILDMEFDKLVYKCTMCEKEWI